MSVTTLEEQPGTGVLRRNLIVYGPTTLATLGLLSISIVALTGGAWGASIPAVLLGLLAFAAGTQFIGSVRDLRSEPTFMRGPIRNTWTKSALLFFFRQHFMLMGGEVFTIAATTFGDLQPEDVVEVHYWPHTRTVIRVVLVSSAQAREAEELDAPLVPVTIPQRASLGQHESH